MGIKLPTVTGERRISSNILGITIYMGRLHFICVRRKVEMAVAVSAFNRGFVWWVTPQPAMEEACLKMI